jgi:ATP-dependent protease ClpP protease subunit
MRLVHTVVVLCSLLACAATRYQTQMSPTLDEKVIDIKDFSKQDIGPIIEKFDELASAGTKSITFRINSYGGSIGAGHDLIQHIEDSKKSNGITTVCIVDLKAFSMGAAFLESNACDHRLMTKRSTLLFHGASTKVEGKADEIESTLNFLKALSHSLATMCADRLGMKIGDFEAKTLHQDWTLTWEEALKAKAVDGVIEVKDVPPPYVLKAPVKTLMQLLGLE